MILRGDDLVRAASESGLEPESLEKVLWLLELLEAIRSHPFLAPRVALKGGTALNLFIFDVPRLSVDIDLNYIGAPDRETMVAERPRMDEAIQAVCGRLGIQVRRVPADHAGGKWRLSCQGTPGRAVTLELDVNYMLRTPLWPVAPMRSRPVAGVAVSDVPLVDPHELAGGKLAALLARQASRDLFDARRLLGSVELDRRRLRQAFVLYGGFNRRDWRTVRVEDVDMSSQEAAARLLPLLRVADRPARAEIESWTERLVADCRTALSVVLPLAEHELEFLARLNDAGEIVPELLTDEPAFQAVIAGHPMLAWKAQNVRAHRSRG